MIPVSVIGYEDLIAGIEGQGLAEGMQVVVKGNERLRNGQRVSLIEPKD
jgi:multidrug efflux pump subunit AcrA (membrane-fusion protein)